MFGFIQRDNFKSPLYFGRGTIQIMLSADSSNELSDLPTTQTPEN